MKLFHVERKGSATYDQYSDFVAAAPDEDTARDMDPSDGNPVDWKFNARAGRFQSWVASREEVRVTYLGEGREGIAQGIVCASYTGG